MRQDVEYETTEGTCNSDGARTSSGSGYFDGRDADGTGAGLLVKGGTDDRREADVGWKRE